MRHISIEDQMTQTLANIGHRTTFSNEVNRNRVALLDVRLDNVLACFELEFKSLLITWEADAEYVYIQNG